MALAAAARSWAVAPGNRRRKTVSTFSRSIMPACQVSTVRAHAAGHARHDVGARSPSSGGYEGGRMKQPGARRCTHWMPAPIRHSASTGGGSPANSCHYAIGVPDDGFRESGRNLQEANGPSPAFHADRRLSGISAGRGCLRRRSFASTLRGFGILVLARAHPNLPTSASTSDTDRC
jgi:hypothetical protein